MCRRGTIRALAAVTLLSALSWPVLAQPSALDWRHIGNSAMELGLPSLATGAVNRVWYSRDGSTLYAQTASGRVFQSNDFESWQVLDAKIAPPTRETPVAVELPETGLWLSGQAVGSNRFYGVGHQAYRSDDGGLSWQNLTAYQGRSILGDDLSDVAISPRGSR